MRVPLVPAVNVNTWDGHDRFAAFPYNYDNIRTVYGGTRPVANHPVPADQMLNAPRPVTLAQALGDFISGE